MVAPELVSVHRLCMEVRVRVYVTHEPVFHVSSNISCVIATVAVNAGREKLRP